MATARARKVPRTIRTFFSVIVLLSIVFVLLNLLLYGLYQLDARQIIVDKDRLRATSLANTVDLVLSEVERSAELLVSNSVFNETLASRDAIGVLDLRLDQRILSSLGGLVRATESIDGLLLFDERTNLFYSTEYGMLNLLDLPYGDELIAAAADVESPVWRRFPEPSRNPYLDAPGESIAYVMSLRAPRGMTPMGFMAIYLNPSVLRALFAAQPEGETVVIDANRRAVFPGTIPRDADEALIAELFADYERAADSRGSERIERDRSSLRNHVLAPLSEASWFLLHTSTIDVGDTLLARTSRVIGMILILNILVFLLVIYGYSRQAVHPVTQLTEFMQRVSTGDFSSEITDVRNDEYGYIFGQFNAMVRDLRRLFDQVYKDELLQKELKLILLRAKVNPHFIYNIFENMRWMVELSRYDELKETLVATSAYYRRAFRDDREEISLGDAADQVGEYIALQNIRFRDRLRAEIEIPEDLRSVAIPNFCLQPVVENAVVHGIEPKVGKGTVRVSARLERDELLVLVADDGVGMSLERLSEMQASLADGEAVVGGALRTIHQRLTLLYGGSGGIRIESTPGTGTTVVVAFCLSAQCHPRNLESMT